MAKIGEKIRVLRIKRGYSQAQLADLMGLKRSAISNYEQGIREPDLDTIEAFADFFDVSIGDLIGRNEQDYRLQKLYDTNNDGIWQRREALRRDPKRRVLFDLAENGTQKDIDAAIALLDALRATNPDFYDGDDPA